MQMFASEDQGVIFYETVISIRKQQHTVIECVPLPWEQYDIIPGYFKVWYMYLCLIAPFLTYSAGIYFDVRGRMVAA